MAKEIETKTILNKTKRRDPWFLDDYTLNPYSACSFNCLYCYIRGSKYGENLEKSTSVKINAPELLEKQLALKSKKGQHGVIVIASATDPYLKLEKDYEITRSLLEIVLKYRFPIHVLTKSDLVIRDLDLIQEISKTAIIPQELEGKMKVGAAVSFSFSTLDDEQARIFESGATPPSQRLEAVRKVKESGTKTGISLMPLLPYITDTREMIEHYFDTFKRENVDYIFPASLTLFGNGKADSKTLMLNAIAKYYPELKPKYEELFGDKYYVPYSYSGKLKKIFKEMHSKYRISDSILE